MAQIQIAFTNFILLKHCNEDVVSETYLDLIKLQLNIVIYQLFFRIGSNFQRFVIQDTLKSLRDMETKRIMGNYCRVQQLPAKCPAEGSSDDTDADEQLSVDKLSEEFLIPQSSKGKPASGAGEEAEPVDSASTVVSISHSQANNSLLRQSSASWQISRGLEWIEMGVRRQEIGAYTEEAVQPERSLVVWNHRLQAAPTTQRLAHAGGTEQPEKINPPGAPALLLDDYPAIDYPMNEDSDSQSVPQTPASRGFSEELAGQGGTVTGRDSHSQSLTTRVSQISDDEASHEAWSFSKDLKSPGLRRRRPTSIHQGAPTHLSFRDSELPRSANAWSDYNLNTDSSSLSSQQSSDSQQLLQSAAFKPDQATCCEPQEEQIFSESELPDWSASVRRVGLRQQRRNSNPNFVTRERHGARSHTRSLHSVPNNSETQLTGLPSRLDGILNRAKVRVRERDGLPTDRQFKTVHRRVRYSPPSPSFSTQLSPPPPSQVDRDTEWVEEVALMRHRALTVSKGWKEQLVDGDDDDKKDRSESPLCLRPWSPHNLR